MGDSATDLFLTQTSDRLVVFFGYLYLAYFTSKRFNAYLGDYNVHNAPQFARPWTTWLRYHLAAAVYFCLFAVLYRILLEYPELIRLGLSLAGSDLTPGAQEFLTSLEARLDLWAPIVSILLLTVAFPRIELYSSVDQDIRRALQRAGNIPRQGARMIDLMSRAALTVEVEKVLRDLSPDIAAAIKAGLAGPTNLETLEKLYLRARHLVSQLKDWRGIASEFNLYNAAHEKSLKLVESEFQRMHGHVLNQLRFEADFGSWIPEEPADATPAQEKLVNDCRKIITEQRRDARAELKELLEAIYTHIACAILTVGRSDRKRRDYLRQFGFREPAEVMARPRSADPNDIGVVALFLIFVMPVATGIATYGFGWSGSAPVYKMVAVWTPMLLFVGLTSVLSAVCVRHCVIGQESEFWQWLKGRRGRPVLSYVVAALAAGVIGTFGLVALEFLDFDRDRDPIEKLVRLWPWGFVPAFLALAIAFHIDSDEGGRGQIAVEALTTGLVTALAGAIGTLIVLEKTADLTFAMAWQRGLNFVLPATLLLGAVAGGIFPRRYRASLPKPVELEVADVDLRALLDESLRDFDPHATRQGVQVDLAVEEDLPYLSCDRNRLRQVLHGVLSNAIEFTPQGGSVRLKAKKTGTGDIEISVTDNGIGMSEGQVDIATTATDRGPLLLEDIDQAGPINLRKARALVELHGGSFGVTSRERAGTEVQFTLPSRGRTRPPQSAVDSPAVSPSPAQEASSPAI